MAVKLHNNIQKTNTYFTELENDKSVWFFKCSEQELLNLVRSLKTNYSSGPDNINSKDLKEIIYTIKKKLVSAINNCLASGNFPSICKISKVIPIYKKGDKGNVENYRPISLTSIFSKILEKVIKSRLVKFFELSKHQYGFQEKSSTQGATVDLIHNIVTKLEDKNDVIVVFVDLQKAFDTVKHSHLLLKLKKLGIRGPAFKLISSFLSERSQFTIVNNEISNTRNVTTGVPQGSVLGPLLYLLYVESLSVAGITAEHYMFADDTALLYHGKNSPELQNTINNDLVRFLHWLSANSLVINESKTVFLHFHQKLINLPVQININNKPISQVHCYKYLGLIIDDKLTWNKHVDNIVNKKLCGLIGALQRVNDFLTEKCKYLLYYAHIQSVLTYLTVVWTNLSVFNTNRLKRFQNKAIKAIFKIPYDTKTVDIYNSLSIMQLAKLQELELCKLIYKIKNKETKTNINLNLKSDKHQYQTRRADNICIARIRTNKGYKSPIYQGCKYFNEIPKNIRNVEKYNNFVK